MKNNPHHFLVHKIWQGYCCLLICLSLTTCTSNTATSDTVISNMQKVELGVITQLKTVATRRDSNPLGSSVGVSVGSGGHAGLYGAFDVGKIFSALSTPSHQLELVIKKQNGAFIAITQPLTDNFKVGDKVKILLRNGLAIVQH